MLQLVLASRNPHKIGELKAILKEKLTFDFSLLSLDDIGYEGDIEENGMTFEENAKIKASVAAKRGYIGIADDSGLSVRALDGAPGLYSARYAGEPCDHEANNKKLLAELSKQASSDRYAEFICTMALEAPDGSGFVATGICPGRILDSYQGSSGFGYDPLFYYEELQKTFAELSPDEKNRVSHRARAIDEFARLLTDYAKEKGLI